MDVSGPFVDIALDDCRSMGDRLEVPNMPTLSEVAASNCAVSRRQRASAYRAGGGPSGSPARSRVSRRSHALCDTVALAASLGVEAIWSTRSHLPISGTYGQSNSRSQLEPGRLETNCYPQNPGRIKSKENCWSGRRDRTRVLGLGISNRPTLSAKPSPDEGRRTIGKRTILT